MHTIPTWKTSIDEGNSALASGRADEALRHYSEAEGLGLSPVLAAGDATMALLLLGRIGEARTRAEAALPHAAGVFVHAQLVALLALADALTDEPAREAFERLERCLQEMHALGLRFDIARSRLYHLMRGLFMRRRLAYGPRSVFRLLVGGMPHPAA